MQIQMFDRGGFTHSKPIWTTSQAYQPAPHSHRPNSLDEVRSVLPVFLERLRCWHFQMKTPWASAWISIISIGPTRAAGPSASRLGRPRTTSAHTSDVCRKHHPCSCAAFAISWGPSTLRASMRTMTQASAAPARELHGKSARAAR
ncbi:unnamed protein product [Prorocentrum cordatum]|uniref:Uncharacterized protein n=1 Tax=Prorocentrum cordatum TaxID=2364126 RepID=A0ABN9T1G3_9DINO|nr:unnamed protein product [Polarella glacialis]